MSKRISARALRSLVGETIIIRSSVLDPNDMTRVRLHRVESEGIWIESQAFTDEVMERCNTATSVSTLVQFIPFARIDYIVGSVRAVSLSERAFGLTEE